MRKGSRSQNPSAEDRALWEAVAKTVAPLKRNQRQAVTLDKPKSPTPAAKSQPTAATKPPAPIVRHRPAPAEPPRLAPLDRRMRTRVVRGTVAIDARIDLHGLTQASAHHRLRGFLGDCQEAGAKLVLVITGKGRPSTTHPMSDERGVLRRMVPMWLGSAEMRPYVIGYEPAGRGHGDEGALYVRVRSQRRSIR